MHAKKVNEIQLEPYLSSLEMCLNTNCKQDCYA